MAPSAEQVEEVLRFARKLEMHSDHEQLMHALPAELCVLLDCSTTALIHWHEAMIGLTLPGPSGACSAREGKDQAQAHPGLEQQRSFQP
jgi:hypothetical protein